MRDIFASLAFIAIFGGLAGFSVGFIFEPPLNWPAAFCAGLAIGLAARQLRIL